MSDFHFNFEETVDNLNSQTPTVVRNKRLMFTCSLLRKRRTLFVDIG